MSGALANFHFIRPAWLLALPVVVAVWWFWLRRTEPLRGWRQQMDGELLDALTIGNRAGSGRYAWGMLAAWLISTVAIAGPTWRLEPNPFAEDALPLMILLKADPSMLREPAPSPLERARLKIADLATARRGQPLGLIAYAGSAHLVLPPTRDTAVVAEMAAQISPDIMPEPGDRLDLAIREAGRVVSAEQGGTLLVLADSVSRGGEDLSANRAYAVQFLALSVPGSPEADSIDEAARTLHATVHESTVDDQDIDAIVRAAAQWSSSPTSGEAARWQEAGYWLVPPIAALVALSFRREQAALAAADQSA